MPNLTDLEIATVAAAVAKHLAGEWTLDVEHQRSLNGPRGLSLGFHNRWGQARGGVSGHLPPGANRLYIEPGELDKLSIGVDLTRDPASIAREIERRLLPEYEPIFHALAERVAKDRAYEQNRDRLYRLIEPLAPRDVRVEAGTDVEVKVVAHLTEEKARAVFALLAERWPEQNAD